MLGHRRMHTVCLYKIPYCHIKLDIFFLIWYYRLVYSGRSIKYLITSTKYSISCFSLGFDFFKICDLYNINLKILKNFISHNQYLLLIHFLCVIGLWLVEISINLSTCLLLDDSLLQGVTMMASIRVHIFSIL